MQKTQCRPKVATINVDVCIHIPCSYGVWLIPGRYSGNNILVNDQPILIVDQIKNRNAQMLPIRELLNWSSFGSHPNQFRYFSTLKTKTLIKFVNNVQYIAIYSCHAVSDSILVLSKYCTVGLISSILFNFLEKYLSLRYV